MGPDHGITAGLLGDRDQVLVRAGSTCKAAGLQAHSIRLHVHKQGMLLSRVAQCSNAQQGCTSICRGLALAQ